MRYQQQAGWTRQLRQYLLEKAGIAAACRTLEVGCGTGAVLSDLEIAAGGAAVGVDIAADSLALARQHVPGALLTGGDAHHLPFAPACFDLTCCHFLLLWVQNPTGAVVEMRRVTRLGGAVLLLAEPDYGGRIDYPQELNILGEWQVQSLRRQGANPHIGRELGSLLSKAGLVEIESGVLGGEWSEPPSHADWEQEWQVLRADLEHLPESQDSLRRIDALQDMDRRAWERGERTLFVPTFYAWGHVPIRYE
jgi:SAM-dependent methyltransferase